MTLKEFEQLIVKLQWHGEEEWEESLKVFIEFGKKQPPYNEWMRKKIIDAAQSEDQ